jgi:hypothetical protein
MAPIAHRFSSLFLRLAALSLAACSSSPSSVLTETDAGTPTPLFCPPGLQVFCECPNGGKGAKVCDSTGQAFGICLGCTEEAGMPDAGRGPPKPDATSGDAGHAEAGPSDSGETKDAPPACAPGTTRCEGTQPELCLDGQWQSNGDNCSVSALLCLDGMCAACAPGAVQCDGQQPQTCSATGDWTNGSPCVEQACQAGACVGLCAPGEIACDPSGTPEMCDDTGEWFLQAACDTSETCVDGECTGVCGPSDVQCDPASNGVDTCTTDGEWSAPTACVDQTCIDGVCTGVCAPGELGCSGLQPETCDATGNWQNVGAACVSPDTCIDGICGTTAIPTTCAEADGEVGCCGPDGQNYYCGDGVTVTPVTCAVGTVCGWSSSEGYYDCVAPPATSDPSGTYSIACQ